MRVLLIVLFFSTCSYSQSVKTLIDDSNIVYKSLALKIARHESGNFTSKVYKQRNNSFGFRTNKGYKKYPSLYMSVKDYERYEALKIETYRLKNEIEYLNRIKRNYSKTNPETWKKRVLRH